MIVKSPTERRIRALTRGANPFIIVLGADDEQDRHAQHAISFGILARRAARPDDALMAASGPSVALWATHLAHPLTGPDQWLDLVDRQLGAARAEGAELLLMPEYACAQWLGFAPSELPADREIAWMAEQGESVLPTLRELATSHGVALLAGTMPARIAGADPPFVNRAHLLLPDGQAWTQDKLCLTPDEREPEAWHLSTGQRLRLFDWRGWRVAMVICLDSELPALAARLAPYQPDLLLVPSMTSRGGYWRVANCCRARAVELFATVCMVGCSGQPRAKHPIYTGGAGVFVPCEQALGLTGIAAELPPTDHVEGAGPLLIARELPLDLIRQLRAEAAEVWPGAWDAAHITIESA